MTNEIPKSDLPEYLRGEVNCYCYWVHKGKLAAEIDVENRDVDTVCKYIENIFQLCVYQEYLKKGWMTVWIYKKSYVLEIIKNAPRRPQTIFDEWVLGKLFSYSDEAIEEYLRNSNSVEFSAMTFGAGG